MQRFQYDPKTRRFDGRDPIAINLAGLDMLAKDISDVKALQEKTGVRGEFNLQINDILPDDLFYYDKLGLTIYGHGDALVKITHFLLGEVFALDYYRKNVLPRRIKYPEPTFAAIIQKMYIRAVIEHGAKILKP